MKGPIKIITVVGTRPNFIKITRFDAVMAKYGKKIIHKLVHTGQHFDYNMSDVFFQQLKIRQPDYFLGISQASVPVQMAQIIERLEKVLLKEKPHWVLVVGDVNSTFAAAFTAHKVGIKVAHIESGLRSFDRTMPEEINRILTDEISDLFFITEKSGYKNLLQMGKKEPQLKWVGNTMIDTLVAFDADIDNSNILQELRIAPKEYALVTMHRPSNVDSHESLTYTLDVLENVAEKKKIVFPIHPRTLARAETFGLKERITLNTNIILTEPLDYFAFQKLVKNCLLVLTDSGGIQEETTFRQIPCLTLRPNTERPVTSTIGSNTLLEFNLHSIMLKVDEILSERYKKGEIPHLWDGKATERIVACLVEQSKELF